MLFTINEIFDIIFMTFIIGYIFKDILSAKTVFNRPYRLYETSFGFRNDRFWQDMKSAIFVVAPAIILHELGHKFSAIFFGFNATFHAAYSWLIFALLLKLMNFGFIFIVPAYVQSSCVSAACMGKSFYLARSLIAIAGPFVNFLLWLGSKFLIRRLPKKMKHYEPLLVMSAKINFFLMIFNILPIPGFDGYHFITNLFSYFASLV